MPLSSPASLDAVLNSIRRVTAATSEADKGSRFEELMRRYLQTEPTYRERFSAVWLWSDWPCRGRRHDIGIDLVAQERATGRYTAIQCKCYDPGHCMQLHDVETFFAALNMTWTTDNGCSDSFAAGIVIATTSHWNDTLLDALHGQRIPCQRLSLADLQQADIDWSLLAQGKEASLPPKQLRPHQKEAIAAVLEGLEHAERGKLIMACGTGKTFTALKLVEEYTRRHSGGKGCALFLVPSIALVAQSVREWMAQAGLPLHPIAVCSDAAASRPDADMLDLSALDLPTPASTDPATIGQNYARFKESHLTVIFSTYQSLDKVQAAQAAGALPVFDLVICDEAHRTTGVSLRNEATGGWDEALFTRVHDAAYIRAHKRLYMTATPRIYTEQAASRAREAQALVASMDDPQLYGEELFRLPFSRAVREGLLTDYKVLVLCVDEESVREKFATELSVSMESPGESGAVQLDDLVKLVGCYNGLRKMMTLPGSTTVDSAVATPTEGAAAEAYDPTAPDTPQGEEDILANDPQPMKRAVAFASSISVSRSYAALWPGIMDKIAGLEAGEGSFFPSDMQHIDGSMDMGLREGKLMWLKEEAGECCRILSNVRCLSEGVDVPALDAVMFLSPRRSQVDIVQSVGRVMRRAPGKKYGYIILPVGVPRNRKPEEILDKEEKYGVIWDVLQALRAHDDRFNAEINSLELNKGRGRRIIVGGVGFGADAADANDGGSPTAPAAETEGSPLPELPLLPGFGKTLEDWHTAIIARTVRKCGDRRYWETWAKNIAEIAERQIAAIHTLLASGRGKEEFAAFLSGLRENTRPDISEEDAVEMLAQQLISRPVFDALFDQYAFAEKNPVSRTMNRMLDVIREQTPEVDSRQLEEFYESVRERARGIDNAAGRQKVIVELYDQFFKNAFPRMADKLGIVYTPVEVVDFIIHSVHHVLQQEFGIPKGLGEEGVRILDPFTGTGTFMVRLIQSGLISRKDLPRKYRHELFASEIVLLAYYIACVNIESAYHGVMKSGREYEPFAGLCLTDTFRMHENSAQDPDLFPAFEENGERLKRLCAQDIRVIIGNPPYSVGQRSANDNNQNTPYPKLDARIEETYAAASTATNKNSLYDSYIRAFRWASDRLAEDGVLAFITNGNFIDKGAAVGFRKTLMKEFSSIYCLNLRGAIRGKAGLDAKKEGQNIFDIMTGVCITVLVKKQGHQGDARLYYHDIGDYLTRQQKKDIISAAQSIKGIKWEQLTPDKHGDWLNHRTEGYDSFLPMGDKSTKGKADTKAIFQIFSNGVKTNRDVWCYNFSKAQVLENMKKAIEFYNSQVSAYHTLQGVRPSVEDFIDTDTTKISWSRAYRQTLQKGIYQIYNAIYAVHATYRPFVKQVLYFDRRVLNDVGPLQSYFPTPQHKNYIISLSGPGARKAFSCLISNEITDLELIEKCQCFPLYWYEKREAAKGVLDLGLEEREGDYIRHDGITDFALRQFRTAYNNPRISKEDIFYYIYGLLHAPEYRTRFANDLKKELPRIPFSKNFYVFSQAGRELATLHLNYETLEPWPVTEERTADNYLVQKMRFPKKGAKDTIIYNSSITLKNIPLEAYDYIINGKSAMEWLMERYAITTDKASGIINDPNAWITETCPDNPRYILDLLKRIIRLSVETVRLVSTLPPVEEM